MKLPKKIDPCPIIDALLEIRFQPNIHPNAVFGILYSALQEEFPKVENLPILQLPDPVRDADSNLKFKPHYKLSDKDFVIQIGPRVLTISSFPVYVGWNRFSDKIYDIIEKFQKIKVSSNVERLGIRYINFFEENIFNDINLEVLIGDKSIDYKNTIIRTQIDHSTFSSTLQITNDAIHKTKKGSLIDIDTFMQSDLEDFFEKMKALIEKGHLEEKELFFALLKEDFLKSLNPTY